MANINIEYSSNLSADETFNKLRGLIADNRDLKSIDKNYSYSFDESAKSANAKGKGFEANLTIAADGDASKISFSIKVGLMLSPFKGVIEEKLKKKLEKELA